MAKIRFENGVVVNFNGNPTQQDIEEVAQKLGISKKKSSFSSDVKESFKSRADSLSEGYLRQQQGKQSAGESILQTVGQGAGLIGDVAFSGVSRLASAITPDFIEKPVVEAGKKLLTKAVSTPLVSSAISKYQQFEKEQPRAAANIGAVGNIASLVPIGKGGAVVSKTALKASQKTGKVIGKTVSKTAELGAKTTKFGLSQVSGLNRETIEQVIKNPKMFTKEVVADMTRENIGKQIKSGITSRINQLQSVGKEYEPLRKLNKVIDVPAETYTSVIDKYGLKLVDGKLMATAESKPFLSGELKQIEDFISQYASTKHTPNSALNAREALSNLSKFDTGKSNNLTSLAKDLRVNLNKIIQDDKVGIPGIKSIDDYYSKEIKILKDIRKDYFVKGTTEFKDNALSKIANLTKEGRQSVLKRLKEIDPNIDFKVNILKAVEDIKSSGGLKIGTYTRGGIAAGGLATGNVPLLLGAIAAQPEVLVPILRAFGRLRIAQKNIVSNIEKKLKSGADLLLNEKSVLNQAIDDYAKKIGEKVKNIKPGLTIEDVSKKPLKSIQKLDSLNPTGSIFAKYTPKQRATAQLADNITTLDRTMGKSADDVITIYRGSNKSGEIVPGDFITTNKQLAKDYAGNGIVLEKKVKLSDVLDDITEPLGEEYIYRPKSTTLKSPLIQEAKKYKTAEEFVKAHTKQDYRSAHQLGLSDSITADKIDIPTLKEAIRTRNGYLNKYNISDLKKLEKLKNNPSADVKIFRASPKNKLNDGDWVTTDRTYANYIKRQNGGKVYEYTVKVKDLRFPKDTETLPSLSMASTFSYSPKTSQLIDIWNKANGKTKLK